MSVSSYRISQDVQFFLVDKFIMRIETRIFLLKKKIFIIFNNDFMKILPKKSLLPLRYHHRINYTKSHINFYITI